MADNLLTVWGPTHVAEVVAAVPHLVVEVLVEPGERRGLERLLHILAEKRIKVRPADRRELLDAGGPDARGCVAVLREYPYCDLEEVIAGAEPPSVPRSPGSLGPPLPIGRGGDAAREGGTRALVLALDSVTDPGNLGAIVRSAVFFGAAGVVLSEHDCAAVNAAVVRRSAGAVFKCRVARVPNLSRALARMKEAGFWVYGTFPAEGRPLPEVRFEAKSVVVLGAEGKGVRPGVRKQCDFPITLAGGFESLNVAAFASVVLYAFRDGEAGGPAR